MNANKLFLLKYNNLAVYLPGLINAGCGKFEGRGPIVTSCGVAINRCHVLFAGVLSDFV